MPDEMVQFKLIGEFLETFPAPEWVYSELPASHISISRHKYLECTLNTAFFTQIPVYGHPLEGNYDEGAGEEERQWS